jgi:hypothetical protein
MSRRDVGHKRAKGLTGMTTSDAIDEWMWGGAPAS